MTVSAIKFKDILLESLMEQHFPSINKLDENLLWLIQLFGLHIVICFIEAARPADYYSNPEAHQSVIQTEIALSYLLLTKLSMSNLCTSTFL